MVTLGTAGITEKKRLLATAVGQFHAVPAESIGDCRVSDCEPLPRVLPRVSDDYPIIEPLLKGMDNHPRCVQDPISLGETTRVHLLRLRAKGFRSLNVSQPEHVTHAA